MIIATARMTNPMAGMISLVGVSLTVNLAGGSYFRFGSGQGTVGWRKGLLHGFKIGTSSSAACSGSLCPSLSSEDQVV